MSWIAIGVGLALPSVAAAQTVSFASAGNTPVGVSPQWGAASDLNGDGAMDLAVANAGSSTVSVLLGNGDGTLQAALTFAVGARPTSVAVADFNRDGRPDLATSNYDSHTVSVLLGNGDGTFQPALGFPTGSTNPNFTAAGDFNQDGNPDLAVANFGGNAPDSTAVSVLLGNGNGTLGPPLTLAAQRGPLWVAVGDLNLDGRDDVVSANFGADTVSVFLGVGDGTFQPGRVFAAGSGVASVAVGEFNGDGMPDLAVSDYFANEVTILLGDGSQSFQPVPTTFSVGAGPVSLSVGNFDGGAEDLVVANWDQNAGNTVSVLVGNGDGTFQAAQDFVAGGGVAAAAPADFDGDGRPDLAICNYGTNNVTMLLNTTAAGSSTLTVDKSGTGSGTVTSSPAGINCGSDCTESYPSGTVVTLTAAPAGGSTFGGWSGGGCSGTGTCTVTMNAATTVAATFTRQQFTLSVTKSGTGSGTVTSNPAGINCGSDCAESYLSGTAVTLTATPASGSSFTGWSGGGCSGTGTCTVTMNSNTSVSASFADTAPPVLSLPADITVRAGLLGVVVTFQVSATDNRDPSPTVSCSPPSGSRFFLGIHTVDCTATDDAGNSSSGSFLVIVLSLL